MVKTTPSKSIPTVRAGTAALRRQMFLQVMRHFITQNYPNLTLRQLTPTQKRRYQKWLTTTGTRFDINVETPTVKKKLRDSFTVAKRKYQRLERKLRKTMAREASKAIRLTQEKTKNSAVKKELKEAAKQEKAYNKSLLEEQKEEGQILSRNRVTTDGPAHYLGQIPVHDYKVVGRAGAELIEKWDKTYGTSAEENDCQSVHSQSDHVEYCRKAWSAQIDDFGELFNAGPQFVDKFTDDNRPMFNWREICVLAEYNENMDPFDMLIHFSKLKQGFPSVLLPPFLDTYWCGPKKLAQPMVLGHTCPLFSVLNGLSDLRIQMFQLDKVRGDYEFHGNFKGRYILYYYAIGLTIHTVLPLPDLTMPTFAGFVEYLEGSDESEIDETVLRVGEYCIYTHYHNAGIPEDKWTSLLEMPQDAIFDTQNSKTGNDKDTFQMVDVFINEQD